MITYVDLRIYKAEPLNAIPLAELQVEWRMFIDAQYREFLDQNYQMNLDAFLVDFPWNPSAGIEHWQKKRGEWEGILAALAKEWWGRYGYVAEFKGLQGLLKKAV